ncbi:hypothetical protein PanWU01x14_150860 [Parasponia andersonii]|uniref:Uncharacterized protein n=1 Tax=Parasponia andersonii TaxID=3476 RepID=A0A2P5CI04_PARAD|nr:hypothetical protein PanWU01x14_150860 [Parasponia andersonii]
MHKDHYRSFITSMSNTKYPLVSKVRSLVRVFIASTYSVTCGSFSVPPHFSSTVIQANLPSLTFCLNRTNYV